MILEDEVISILAAEMRKQDFCVLAENANQISSFCYRLDDGRRKAPDVVAYKGGILGLFEAKVKPCDLFQKKNGGASDYDCIIQISKSEEIKSGITLEARRRLKACGIAVDENIHIITGMVARGSILEIKPEVDHSLILLDVDYERAICRVDQSNPFWSKIWQPK